MDPFRETTCSFSTSECSEQLQHVALTPFAVFPLKLQKVPSPPQAHASGYALYYFIYKYNINIMLCVYIYINIIIGWLGLGTTGTADDCIPLASHQWPKGFGSAIMSSSRKSPNHILLEDVVNTWLNSSEDKIPMIRENEAGCRSGWVCIVSVEAWLNVWLEERHYWPCSEKYIYIW